MSADVTLFGKLRCNKTRFYQAELEARGIVFELAEVDKDTDAARRLTELAGDPNKFPTLEINGRKVRNPTLPDLEKELARSGLYDPGLVHDTKSQRIIRHMSPSDAFVSYTWQGDRMVLGHIEVDPSLRGTGVGARFAIEVFQSLVQTRHEVRLTCPFLRKVASTQARWRDKFNLGDQI